MEPLSFKVPGQLVLWEGSVTTCSCTPHATRTLQRHQASEPAEKVHTCSSEFVNLETGLAFCSVFFLFFRWYHVLGQLH